MPRSKMFISLDTDQGLFPDKNAQTTVFLDPCTPFCRLNPCAWVCRESHGTLYGNDRLPTPVSLFLQATGLLQVFVWPSS